MEGYVAFLPVAFVFLLLTLSVGRGHVFPWTHEAPPNPEKATYFNPAFITIRDIVVFGLIVCARHLVHLHVAAARRRPHAGVGRDVGGEHARAHAQRVRRRASRDSLDAFAPGQARVSRWSRCSRSAGRCSRGICRWGCRRTSRARSTAGGSSWAAGSARSWCSRCSCARGIRSSDSAGGLITETHFHDIGKLCFAFTAFWGYLTFGQYLVIWYGNMGEETFFMHLRLISPWKWVTVASVVLVFFVPFFGLLSRAAKVSPSGG